MKINNSRKKWYFTTLAIIIVAALLVGYGALASSKHLWPYQNQAADTTSSSTDDLNSTDTTYGSEKNEPTTKPTDQTSKPSTPTDDESTKQIVDVSIGYVGTGSTVEVRAYVSGVIEGTGTCTALFTRGNETVSASSKGFVDATTTQCEPIEIDPAELSGGGWQLLVSYSSPTARGASISQEFTL